MLCLCLSAQDSVRVEVKLLGLKKTLPWVILQELPFAEGEKVSLNNAALLIQQSRQNLYNLALFNEVKVDTHLVHPKLQLIIHLKERWYIWGSPRLGVEERNSYDFVGALQRRNLDRLVYGAYLQWQNLTGRNELMVLDVQAGFSQRFKLDFIRPSLFRKQRIDLRLGYHFYLEKQVILGTANARAQWRGNLPQEYRRTHLAYLALNKRFSPRLHFRGGINLQSFQYADSLFLDENLAESIAPLFLQDQSLLRYPSFTLSLFRDERDIKSFPLEGYKFHFFGRYAGGPGNSAIQFGRLGFTWAHFLSLSRRWKVSYGVQHIQSIGDRIPWQEKNFLGLRKREFAGINSELRGYQAYTLASTQMSMAKFEVKWAIFPYQTIKLPFIPFEQLNEGPAGIYLSAFVDQAWLADNGATQVDPTLLDRWLIGYGLGLNLIGFYDMLLRVEYARNHLHQGGLFLQTTIPIK